jgi:hypothetical protein
MNLLTALIPIGLSIIAGGGFGQQPQTGSKASAFITDGLGKDLAESFLLSSGITGEKGGSITKGPFGGAPEIPRARSVQELTRGNPAIRGGGGDPVRSLIQSDPRVSSAVQRMMSESSHPQMTDFRSKYATRATVQQGRKTLAVEQPGNIRVGQ